MARGERWAQRCAADGEFRLLSRFWNGRLCLVVGDQRLELMVGTDGDGPSGRDDGTPSRDRNVPQDRNITVSGPAEVWAKLLAPVPPPFFNDLMPARAFGLNVEPADETFWQYYPAIRRAIELLRAADEAAA